MNVQMEVTWHIGRFVHLKVRHEVQAAHPYFKISGSAFMVPMSKNSGRYSVGKEWLLRNLK